MKVLWLRPSKGANISVRRERIAEELREKGYEIDICDASGIDAITAAKKALWGDYDVIAGNVRMGLYLGYPLARLLRLPFLGDVSDPISDIDFLPWPLFKLFEWVEWRILERADATVFVYESSYQDALNHGIANAEKLPNAVNFDQFSNPPEGIIQKAHMILTEEGVNLEKPLAIYIGVFSKRYLISEILRTAKITPNWEFVFLGEGPLEEDVVSTDQSLDNFNYLGAYPYKLIPGFLSHADVGFCFKDAEQPLKLKEYGAANLPIIARPGELSKWYCENELLFVEPNPELISKTLNELHDNPDLFESYADSASTIAKEWTWEEIAENYDRIFNKITDNI